MIHSNSSSHNDFWFWDKPLELGFYFLRTACGTRHIFGALSVRIPLIWPWTINVYMAHRLFIVHLRWCYSIAFCSSRMAIDLTIDTCIQFLRHQPICGDRIAIHVRKIAWWLICIWNDGGRLNGWEKRRRIIVLVSARLRHLRIRRTLVWVDIFVLKGFNEFIEPRSQQSTEDRSDPIYLTFVSQRHMYV